MEAQTRPSVGELVGVAFWAICIAGFQAMLWLGWLFLVGNGVAYLTMILGEYDTLLPPISQQLIAMSIAVSKFWYLLVLFGFPCSLLEVVIVVAAKAKPNRWLTTLRYACVAFLSLLPLLTLLYSIIAFVVTIWVAASDIVPP